MKLITFLTTGLFSFVAFDASSNPQTYVTVEEARSINAKKAMPEVFVNVDTTLDDFRAKLQHVKALAELTQVTTVASKALWTQFKEKMQLEKGFDDRGLYWSRLALLKEIRIHQVFRQMTPLQQDKLIWQFELNSRGNSDINYKTGLKKVFVTGFDPFLLDRNIKQSNPSGIAALWLDGKVLEYQGAKVQVEAVVVPVRFADFDQGLIEHILIPVFAKEKVSMVATISMGRTHFDLERFPGLRRSSAVPDNVNVFTGANKQAPLKPFLYGKELAGPEFVEFSLPVELMQQATGHYKIIDNHKVSTLSKSDYSVPSLESLDDETAVAGAGGGYLSNEISYRSILLRNQISPNIAVGHIHTPRYVDWQFDNVKSITMQIQSMLALSIPAL